MAWLAGLSIRGRTLVVGSVLTASLVGLGAAVPIPYVALGPGVTYDTLGSVDGTPVISFTGDDIPPSVDQPVSGHLNMTTISVTDNVPLFEALGLWSSGDYALVPREDVFPPDKTVEEVNEENAELFSDSQSSAEIAALKLLGYPAVTFVGTIPNESPSAGLLEPQDRILAVDDEPVTDFPSLQAALEPTSPGQVVELTLLRAGAEVQAKITLGSNPEIGPQGYLGVGAAERPEAPFSIDIALENIGGPSAGLMFALGIVDKLSDGNLTGGAFVAGTGTMAIDGAVGPIGGILMKMIAARDAGASVFLVPADNCAEALTRIPAGLRLVRVATLADGVEALATLAAGGEPPAC